MTNSYARGAAFGLAVACAITMLPGAASAAAGEAARPTAIWRLETSATVNQAGGLLDGQPSLNGDTPLTGTNISWQDDARFIGSQGVAFDGVSSSLSASPSALNTAGTFSLAAWVRLTDTSASRVFASKAGANGRSTLSVGYDKASDRWQVQLPSKLGKGAKVSVARSATAPKAGLWTHLAVVHDATARTLTLWVDGVAEATVNNVDPVADQSGAVRLGRGDTGWWKGNLAEVRVFDQALVTQDFTGWASGEPGLLQARPVGLWNFDSASPCYAEDLDPTLCSAPEVGTGFQHAGQLALTEGTFVDYSSRGSQALILDGTHWIDDPSDPHYGAATREYGRSQTDVSQPGEATAWQDTPVLRTDQSYSVAVWVRLDPARGAQTVVSQDGVDRSVFQLGFDPANGGNWAFGLNGATVATSPATDADQWHHVVAVLDAAHRQVKLYVDGTSTGPIALSAAAQPQQGPGSLLVGRATTQSGPDGWLYGQVDDLGAYQGILTDADVQRLFTS